MGTEYPTVKSWLTTAPPAHPWRQLLTDRKARAREDLLAPLEKILAALDAAALPRLQSRRKAFASDIVESHVVNLRTELLVAYLLARAGIPFEFGGRGQPDLCCGKVPDNQVWIEVTTRARDDLDQLRDDLHAALGDLPVRVTVRIPYRRLKIPEPARSAVCARVCAEVAKLDNGETVDVALAELDGEAHCVRGTGVDFDRVRIEVSSPELTDHMADVERAFLDVVRDKAVQAQRGGWHPRTLLVVDMSRLGKSWLRPPAVWAGRLGSLGLDWATLPFVGVLAGFSSLSSVTLPGAYRLRPDLGTSSRHLLEDVVLGALGYSPDRT